MKEAQVEPHNRLCRLKSSAPFSANNVELLRYCNTEYCVQVDTDCTVLYSS